MNRLEKARLALDLSQGDVAKKIGVSASGYSGWETGNRKPEPGMYAKLAEVFGVTSEEIVEWVAEAQQAREKREAATSK